MREGKIVIENNSHQSKISACRLSKKQIVCAYKADFFTYKGLWRTVNVLEKFWNEPLNYFR